MIPGYTKKAFMKLAAANGHRVSKNETFEKIDRMYNLPIGTMQKLNPGVNARSIRVGSTLNLPPGTTPIQPQTTTTGKGGYTRTRPKGVYLMHMPSVDHMYGALEYAETAGMVDKSKGESWWRRTTDSTAPGSAAFGPLQITPYTMTHTFKNYPKLRDRYGEWYDTHMLPMQQKFLVHGKNSKMKGYDANYDYGGHGYWDPVHNDMYMRMAKDLIRIKGEYADGVFGTPDASRVADTRANNLIRAWRGKTFEEDPEYYEKAMDHLYKTHPYLFSDHQTTAPISSEMQRVRDARIKSFNDSWIWK